MEVIRVHRADPNVHTMERWACVIGGGLAAWSGARQGRDGAWRMLTGAALLHRGISGNCQLYKALGVRTAPTPPNAVLPYELGIRARAAVTIDQDREHIYRFWRNLENLPRFMKNVESVESKDGKRYHWVVRGLSKSKVTWDAEIINELPNELIAWKSLPGGDVDHAGSVRFKDAPGGRGTEIHVEMQYNPPGGVVGAYIARLFGREPEQQITADLIRLKQYLESGELATTEGQTKGAAQLRRTIVPTLEEVTA